MPSRILDLACQRFARLHGLQTYTIPQLERDSGLTHSVILRAIREEKPQRPRLETVRRLAEVLEVASDPELEDHFYNGFGYASPRQIAQVQAYVEQREE